MKGENDFSDSVSEKDNEMEKIYEHIEKHIGKPTYTSFNIDTIPNTIDVSLYTLLANNKRRYHTIITSGMSGLPTEVPEDQDVWKYTELMIYLPESFPFSKESIKNLKHYWPIGWLKKLSRFPHENNTWFCWGDTIPNGEPPIPVAADADFCCMLLLPPIREDENFFELKISEEKTIRFLVVIPIYREEMEYKLTNGYEKLLDKFDEYNINDIINVNRQNTCK